MSKKATFISLLSFSLIPLSYHQSNAQWQQVNGPYGGSIRQVSSNSIVLYASLSGQGQGCYKSYNQGSSWVSINDTITNLGANTVNRIDLNDTVIYLFSSSSIGWLIRSFDDGLSWTPITSGLPGPLQIYAVFIKDSHFFLGTQLGVFHSPDFGDTWQEANNGLSNIWIKKFCAFGNSIYGITQEGEIFETDNFGDEWFIINSTWLPLFIHLSSFMKADSLFIVSTTERGLFSLCIGDTSWQQRNIGLTDTAINTLIRYDSVLLVGTQTQGVFISENNGGQWYPFSDGLLFMNISSLTIQDTFLFAGTGGGVYRTGLENPDWIEMNDGLMHINVSAMVKHDTILFAGTYVGIFISYDNGNHWERPLIYPNYIQTMAVKDTFIFAGTSQSQSGGVFRSSDNGQSWIKCNDGLWNINTRSFIITDSIIYLGTEDGIYHSTDDGDHWSELYPGFNAFAMVKKDSIFFVTDYGGNDGIYRSTDNGLSWQLLDNGITPEQGPVTLVLKDSLVFAGTIGYGGGLYRIHLLGDTWDLTVNGLPTYDIHYLVIDDTTLYASTYFSGEYISTNNGDFWHEINEGLPSLGTYKAWNIDDYLYLNLLGPGAGLWRRNFSDMHVVKIHPDTLVLKGTVPSCDTLFIEATGSWNIQDSLPIWLGIEKTEGIGNDTILFQALETNESENPRNIILTLSSENLPDHHILVIQNPKPASIDEPMDKRQIILYPNPSTENIVIKSTEIIETVNVTTLQGMVLISQKVRDFIICLDISYLPPGMYFVNIMGFNWDENHKIILKKM